MRLQERERESTRMTYNAAKWNQSEGGESEQERDEEGKRKLERAGRNRK